MSKKGTAKSVSPLPKPKPALAPAAEEPQDYKFILTFNSKAELVDVSHPENLGLEMTANHLAVAQLFLAQEIVKKAEGKK